MPGTLKNTVTVSRETRPVENSSLNPQTGVQVPSQIPVY